MQIHEERKSSAGVSENAGYVVDSLWRVRSKLEPVNFPFMASRWDRNWDKKNQLSLPTARQAI